MKDLFGFRVLLTVVLSLILPFTASGQLLRQPVIRVNPPATNVESRVGGALRGLADLQSAGGNLLIQQEQARIAREKAKQAEIETRKQLFDQRAIEKANTPSFTEEESLNEKLRFQRLISGQVERYEITSGKALNSLTPFLFKMNYSGVQGPEISLEQNMVAKLNVTASDQQAQTPAIFKEKLRWPFELRGPEQKRIDELVPVAVAQAKADKLDPKVYFELKGEADKLNGIVVEKLGKHAIDGQGYLESKRFITALESGITSLRRADAANHLNGQIAARGRNVQELVTHMTKNGLQYSPATPGNEPAYLSVYNSMMAYGHAAQDSPGFRVDRGSQFQKLRPDLAQ